MLINETYKYLGVDQTTVTSHKQMKQKITEKVRNRIKAILKSKLSARNMTTAINTYALSVATYTFGPIKWTNTELQELNRMVRTLCTKYRTHHPRSSVERFHLPRAEGGRGITDLEVQHNQQINKLREYFNDKSNQSTLHKAVIEADRSYTPLNLTQPHNARRTTEIVKEKLTAWLAKPLHGKYPNNILEEHIDREASLAWLRNGNIFPETEGFIIAIQDRVIATRNYLKYIVRDPSITDDRCRMCRTTAESIEHIISGCSALAANEYTRRHDNVGKIIYQQMLKQIQPNHNIEPYYSFTPQSVITTDTHTLYWNRSIITDRAIPNNRPDIVLTNKTEKTTYLIDIAVPGPENTEKKRREKIQKYLPLSNEIKEIWDQEKVVIIPIIIGAMGEIPKALYPALETLNIEKNIYLQMQKTVIIETCSIVRKFLSSNEL